MILEEKLDRLIRRQDKMIVKAGTVMFNSKYFKYSFVNQDGEDMKLVIGLDDGEQSIEISQICNDKERLSEILSELDKQLRPNKMEETINE